MDINIALKLAKEAAVTAGNIQIQYLNKRHDVHFKGEINMVTEVDILCEKAIISLIKDRFPDHITLAEESGAENNLSPYKWIIDPLDGTTNYAHGFPFFCTSIALEFNKDIILGVAYDPLRKELYHAVKKGGAFLNDTPINVSNTHEINRSLLTTGFAYDVKTYHEANLGHFRNFLLSAQAIRRPGSAVLDLCYVACGRFDGYWEARLFPWDMAAGILIVREAGGVVTDFKGNLHDVYSPEIVASNGFIHSRMLEIINNKLK